MDQSVTTAQFATSMRAFLLAAGGWLVGKGYLSNELMTASIPVLMIAIPYIWALYTNWSKEKKVQARETVAVRAGLAAQADQATDMITPAAVGNMEARNIIAAYGPATN